MRSRPYRLSLVVTLLLAGCSHSPVRVDCDGRLEPINPIHAVTPVQPKPSPAAGHQP